jgi:hypothetical protein
MGLDNHRVGRGFGIAFRHFDYDFFPAVQGSRSSGEYERALSALVRGSPFKNVGFCPQ